MRLVLYGLRLVLYDLRLVSVDSSVQLPRGCSCESCAVSSPGLPNLLLLLIEP